MPQPETLFLLPGLMCDETVWEHQYTHLSDHARIIIPDFRGYNSLTAMARYVLEMAPERYSIAGHSMGGRVALELFNLAPDRMTRLALLDTGVHSQTADEVKIRQSYTDLALTSGMRAVADAWVKPMVHPDRHNDTGLIERITEMVERTSVDEFIWQIRALLNRPDASVYLPLIQCTTLLLVGSHDTWSPPDQHDAMLDKIRGATLTVIEGAGHMTPMEKPEAVTAALHDWLLVNCH
jgi:pimeloyl-ACP methyl ester carboxylesterase